MDMQEASKEELLNTENSEIEQTQEEVINKDDYKNLQSYSTKVNQERIDLAKKLVEKDKSEVLNIKDKKLQNKIIKDLYGYDTLEEVQAIHGDKFFNEKEEEYEDSDVDELRKELKLIRYRSEKSELEAKVSAYSKEHKLTEEEVDAIKEEMKYFSNELSLDEKISKAAKIIVKKNPYIELNETQVKSNNTHKKPEVSSNEIDDVFTGILNAQKAKTAYKKKFNI